MDKLGFVILHYIVLEETIACVKSIIDKVDTKDYEIIIVDNASPNESGKKLLQIFAENTNIHVILNSQNIGFSKGNNVGYRYAKGQLKCNYIILANNDILLKSVNLMQRIVEDYSVHNASVIGPKVYTYGDARGIQNPQWKSEKTDLERIKKLRTKEIDLEIGIALTYIKGDKVFFETKRLLGKIFKRNKVMSKSFYEEFHDGIQLHGCFLIFTPAFTSEYEGLDEVTFMYHEEMLLYRKMYRANNIMLYDPQIKVFHAGKTSTKKVSILLAKSRRIRYKIEQESIEEVLNFIKNNG